MQGKNTEDTLSQNIDNYGDEDVTDEIIDDPVEQVLRTSGDESAEKSKSSFKKPVTIKQKWIRDDFSPEGTTKSAPFIFQRITLLSLEDFNEFDTIDFQMEVQKFTITRDAWIFFFVSSID